MLIELEKQMMVINVNIHELKKRFISSQKVNEEIESDISKSELELKKKVT